MQATARARAPAVTVLAVVALVLLVAPSAASDVEARLVRIQVFDSEDEFRGCGTGYLTGPGQIVTAYHVLVPPGGRWCGKSDVGDFNITQYHITNDRGQVTKVGCADMRLYPSASERPAQDVGLLHVNPGQAKVLEVSSDRIDGFVSADEFRTERSGVIHGYLDSDCRNAENPRAVEQSVVLGRPRTVSSHGKSGEFILIPLPQSPGTSGSPVVWEGTDRVIGIYVGEQIVDLRAGKEGLISSFDDPSVRQEYRNLTGTNLVQQVLTPLGMFVGVAANGGNAFGAGSIGLGVSGFFAWEFWARQSYSFGAATSLGATRHDMEWTYRDPLGDELETEKVHIYDVVGDGAVELRLLRASAVQPFFGLGARLRYFPKLESPEGVDPLQLMFGGLARGGLEVPIRQLLLSVLLDGWYGWAPNTEVQYTGLGPDLAFVGDNDTQRLFTLQGSVALAWIHRSAPD